MAKNDIEIYLQADGFYAGHMKKDGTLAAGAYKITGEDIMTMFTSFFLDYCKETGGQKLLMQDSAGALFVTPEKSLRAISPKVKVGSTVGAGDSVVAAIAYANDSGMSLEDTIRLSMATGSANVMQSGTQAAPRELIDTLIDKVGIEDL